MEMRCRRPDAAARTQDMVAGLNVRVCMCEIPHGWNTQFHILDSPVSREKTRVS